MYRYITGIIKNKGQKVLAINGMPDHIHIFIGIRPSCCLSDLVREVKKSSTEFIKEKKFSKYQFNWQEGFGAFSYSNASIESVCRYIWDQKKHHEKRSFRQEFVEFLNDFEIEYKDAYLFEWFDSENSDTI